MYVRIGSWAVLVCVLSGCRGGEVAVRIGASQTSKAQALTEQSAPIEFHSSDGAAFTLTAARANFRDIEIDLPDGQRCADLQVEAPAQCKSEPGGSETIIVRGPIIVDLVTGTSTPDLSTVRIPAGTYSRIDFRLDDTTAESGLPTSDELYGRSFVASAAFEHEGTPAELQIALQFNEDFRVEEPEGVDLRGADGELLTLLRPELWFEELPVGDCIAKGDVVVENGTYRLDDRAGGGCSGAEGVLKRNLKRSADLTRN